MRKGKEIVTIGAAWRTWSWVAYEERDKRAITNMVRNKRNKMFYRGDMGVVNTFV
jgi:hypothetical protein